MQQKNRRMARMRLDLAMRPFQGSRAAKIEERALLRAVRQAVGIPMKEIAERMGVSRSVVFDMEECEEKRTISLRSLERVAEAMECRVVYGIVPRENKSLEDLAEERMWARALGVTKMTATDWQRLARWDLPKVKGEKY